MAIPVFQSTENVNTGRVAASWFVNFYHSLVASGDDGAVYYAYVDTSNQTIIVRRGADGTETSAVIEASTVQDQYHTNPAVGVDSDGYIHVAYNMHYAGPDWGTPATADPDYPWQYKVSLAPNTLASGFEFVGTTPARTIASWGPTYQHFYRDNEGVLYCAYRSLVTRTGDWTTWRKAGCVARYNTTTRAWTVLGGTDHTYEKCLCWSQYGAEGDGYQYIQPVLHFDENNRMHMAFSSIRNDGTSHHGRYVCYAYSDDQGDTWYKADNTQITSLPMRPELNADVAYDAGEGYADADGTFARLSVGVNPQGRPWVAFHPNTNKYSIVTWNGGSWVFSDQTANIFPFLHVVSDKNGIIYCFGYNTTSRLYVSDDSGATWSNLIDPVVPRPGSASFDGYALNKLDTLRFINLPNGTRDVYLYSGVYESVPDVTGLLQFQVVRVNWLAEVDIDHELDDLVYSPAGTPFISSEEPADIASYCGLHAGRWWIKLYDYERDLWSNRDPLYIKPKKLSYFRR